MEYFYVPTIGRNANAIFTDICAGQNKKKITILYILWMVYTGIFSCVTMLFFQGHTNSAAYILFNLLEVEYHNRDIFTYE